MSPFRSALLLLGVFCLVATLAVAQTNTGSLVGAVTDPNGAAVPNAKLKVRHDATGVETETVSSDAGLYVFASLAAGDYTLTIEHAGFKKLVRANIPIRIATRQVLNLQLEIGAVETTVEVSETAPLLQTSNAELGANFSPKFMTNSPLFTGGIRNPEAFIAYMPGVNNGSGDSSISGSTRRSKEVLIDGASQTIPESGGVVFNFPASEQFGEFKLLTNNFSAEYGRTGGGIEVFLTKSGTNDLHGGAFLNMRRDVWNAAGWTVNQNRANRPGFRPKERFNEVGGVIGGPVWLGKLYDGRNKTFFYFTHVVDQRPATISTAIYSLPTVRMKRGDFSEWSQLIYDPASTSGNTRTPFGGNLVPENRWSRISRNVAAAIPDATGSGILNNWTFVNRSGLDRYIQSYKIDHNVTVNNRLSFYFSREYFNSPATSVMDGPLGQSLGESTQKPENYRMNHDLILKPTILLHSTFGFTRQQQGWDNPAQKGFGSKAGFPGLTGLSDATPRIRFATVDQIPLFGVFDGKVSSGTQLNWTFHFHQNLTWLKGKHEWRFGWDFRRLRTFSDPLDLAFTNGEYQFERAQTALPTALATTGHSFASMLLGLPSTGNILFNANDPRDSSRYGYQAFYINDNWKVTSRVTLTIGMRYDVPLARYNPLGYFTSFDPNLPNPRADGRPGALKYSGFGPGRINAKRFGDIDWKEFGPRAGIAWQFGPRTVVRGGYGIYYAAGNHTTGGFCLGCAFGFTAQPVTVSPDGFSGAFQWDGGVPLPAGFRPPPFIDPAFANDQSPWYLSPRSGIQPRIHQWSINVQHELPKGFLLDVAYSANRGYNLNSTIYLNQVPPNFLGLGALLGRRITDPEVVARGFRKPYSAFPDTGTLAQALRPYPQFQEIPDHYGALGKRWYDSLQVRFERRYGIFQMMAAYTLSKTLSTLSRSQTAFQDNPQDSYNFAAEKELMAFDTPHVFNLLTSFDLPFGKGKKWVHTGPIWLNALVGGWTIAGVQQYQSGGLLTLQATNTLGAGVLFTNFRRANTTGQPFKTNISRGDLDPNNPDTRWLNPASVASPGQFEFGSAARYQNDMRNPMRMTENLGIIKRTTLYQRSERAPITLDYRADAFNLFNRTNFGGVVTTVGAANYGRPTGVQSGPRLITMGLRLDF